MQLYKRIIGLVLLCTMAYKTKSQTLPDTSHIAIEGKIHVFNYELTSLSFPKIRQYSGETANGELSYVRIRQVSFFRLRPLLVTRVYTKDGNLKAYIKRRRRSEKKTVYNTKENTVTVLKRKYRKGRNQLFRFRIEKRKVWRNGKLAKVEKKKYRPVVINY